VGEFKHIFTPLKIGRMTVKNRIETAPAMPFLATMDCDVSRELIEWERTLAKGGAAIVTVGDSPIYDELASGVGHILNLGTDKIIPGLSKLAEVIQRYGAKASIELTNFDPAIQGSPNELTLDEIKVMIETYAGAAYRCMIAGMDMIMVHGGHGHLISQFLSPRVNSRKDEYGGSFRNRSRLVIDILEAIRERVGDNLAIEYRISADELTPDGLTIDEQMAFAKVIQDKIDLLHVSAGNIFTPGGSAIIIQPTYIPRGVNVHFAGNFKKELDIPVTTLGSVDLEMAEQIIAEDKADMVAMNRALIADPEGVNKARRGRADEIRPCIRCNLCIERTHTYFMPLRCAVNPLSGREAEFMNLPAPAKKKKVVVIGGGPAGMEAARRAADRGHKVVLFEKTGRLGGALIMAAAPPFKADMKDYLDWAIHSTMNTPNLMVKLSTEATPENIKTEDPDTLIIAVGSSSVMPDIPGIDKNNVVWAGDVNIGKAKVGDRVLLAGSGLTGSETALLLAQQGKKVTLIDMLPLDQIDAGSPVINITTLRSMVEELQIEVITEVKLDAVTETGAVIMDKNKRKIEIACDTVVLSLGVTPRTDIVALFEELVPDVHVIGDCNNKRGKLYNAISEGFFAAMDL
jgi:2,4-dienoyl-CoA reductase-like NADH-dependent reductase (Old Yellow Enzyme family)/thioredoxin reductase